ncbi:MAG: GNAT family N-acetyltransferase [Gammaproteobacteria bacterium]|nr:GNAT family N-acetyltransferase [Gammaproteobacteria bacterium]
MEIHIVVVFDADQAVLLLPLARESRDHLTRLVWLGGDITDYRGPLIRNSAGDAFSREQFTAIWQEVHRILPPVDIIELLQQPEWIAGKRNPFATYLACQPGHQAFVARLEESFEVHYQQRVNAKGRSTDRRKERRIQDSGELVFRVVRGGTGSVELLRALGEQKAHNAAKKNQGNVLALPGMPDFVQVMTENHSGDGFIHLSTLELDGEPLAIHWGMTYRGRFHHLLPSYTSGSNRQYSPGRLHLLRMLRWCHDNRISLYDFTIGDEDYKKVWSNETIVLFDHKCGVSWRGRIAVFSAKAKSSLKKQIRKIWRSEPDTT